MYEEALRVRAGVLSHAESQICSNQKQPALTGRLLFYFSSTQRVEEK